MSNDNTISLGACPTCKGPVQHISDDGVKVDYRHVDLSTVRLERFREIAIDALQKITGEPSYSPSDLLQHGAVTAPQTWVCGAPEGFSKVPPEAKAELRDYAEWLRLPKPRQEFHAWRRDGRGGEE
jgi:hypothetical protein